MHQEFIGEPVKDWIRVNEARIEAGLSLDQLCDLLSAPDLVTVKLTAEIAVLKQRLREILRIAEGAHKGTN